MKMAANQRSGVKHWNVFMISISVSFCPLFTVIWRTGRYDVEKSSRSSRSRNKCTAPATISGAVLLVHDAWSRNLQSSALLAPWYNSLAAHVVVSGVVSFWKSAAQPQGVWVSDGSQGQTAARSPPGLPRRPTVVEACKWGHYHCRLC